MKKLPMLLLAAVLCVWVPAQAFDYQALTSEQPSADKYSPAQIAKTYSKREVMIRMRDGIELFTAIYEPKDQSTAHPIIMQRTCYSCRPYGPDSFPNMSSSAPYVDAGYIFVYQDVRGKNHSGGDFDDIRPFIEGKKLSKKEKDNAGCTDEASDTYDTIDWLIKNTNNNGCVGQKGISYPGFYATMGALCGHPAMKAVSPQAPVTDWFIGDDVHHNGAFMLGETVSFQPFFEYGMSSGKAPGPRKFPTLMHTDIYSDYLRIGTFANITAAYADSIAYFRTLREHPDRDEYWISHTVTQGHLHDVKPAVMVVGGLYDKEDCYGAQDVYKTIKRDSPATDLYLVEGPWYHGAWSRGMQDFWKNMYFGEEATSEYYNAEIEYPFFAYYLEGKGSKPQTGARIFDSGSRKWTQYDEGWPEVSLSDTTPYYLHADGSVSTTLPSDKDGKVSYHSDPSHPVPYFNEIETRISKDYMIADQRFAAQRPDVVCFSTETLGEDLRMAGEIEVGLQVDITSTDADFIVKVIDVFPDDFSWYTELGLTPPNPMMRSESNDTKIPRYTMAGYQLMVRGEVMRGKYRESFSEPKPFTSGETTLVKFSIPDIAHTFKAGHKLMIQVQSTWFPLVDRNPQTFCNIYSCDESAYTDATITLHCSPSAPSYIKLPVARP